MGAQILEDEFHPVRLAIFAQYKKITQGEPFLIKGPCKDAPGTGTAGSPDWVAEHEAH
jgi:hypothetical protein